MKLIDHIEANLVNGLPEAFVPHVTAKFREHVTEDRILSVEVPDIEQEYADYSDTQRQLVSVAVRRVLFTEGTLLTRIARTFSIDRD